MSNERPNEPGSWKERLGRLEVLPGESWTGKEASWDRLHARLHGQRERHKKRWWLAAAALLPVVTGALLLLLRQQPPPPVAQRPRPPRHTAAPAGAGGEQSAQAKGNSPAPVQKQRMEGIGGRAVINRKSQSPAVAPLPAGNGIDTGLSLQAGIIPAPADTPLLTRVAMPPKKQLHVVAFNELEEAPSNVNLPPLPTRRAARRSLRLLLSHNEAAGAVTPERQLEDNNPFRIKISPQN